MNKQQSREILIKLVDGLPLKRADYEMVITAIETLAKVEENVEKKKK